MGSVHLPHAVESALYDLKKEMGKDHLYEVVEDLLDRYHHDLQQKQAMV